MFRLWAVFVMVVIAAVLWGYLASTDQHLSLFLRSWMLPVGQGTKRPSCRTGSG